MKIMAIYRERIFSPGKVREDADILDCVLEALFRSGHEPHARCAEATDGGFEDADLILSMAQSGRLLGILARAADEGIPVVNAVSAVRNCYRKALVGILSGIPIAMPAGRIVSIRDMTDGRPFGDHCGYWMKRGDLHALSPADVVKIDSPDQLQGAVDHFRGQGVDQVLIQAHVDGLRVKFYGVGTGPDCYFRAFPAPSGEEAVSGVDRLSETARLAARNVGLDIYGGDAVLTRNGQWMLIDLNDWPTFSPCRESAAQAIAGHLMRSCAIKGMHDGIA